MITYGLNNKLHVLPKSKSEKPLLEKPIAPSLMAEPDYKPVSHKNIELKKIMKLLKDN